MVSNRPALRKARRNFRLDERARRSCANFERITVQESSEKSTRRPMTASGMGSELFASSQILTCSKRPPANPDVNRFPFSLDFIVIDQAPKQKCLKMFWPREIRFLRRRPALPY